MPPGRVIRIQGLFSRNVLCSQIPRDQGLSSLCCKNRFICRGGPPRVQERGDECVTELFVGRPFSVPASLQRPLLMQNTRPMIQPCRLQFSTCVHERCSNFTHTFCYVTWHTPIFILHWACTHTCFSFCLSGECLSSSCGVCVVGG